MKKKQEKMVARRKYVAWKTKTENGPQTEKRY